MNRTTIRKWFFIVLSLGIPAMPATQTGTVTVLTVDPNGAVVSGAVVTLTPPGGGAPVFGRTDGDGFAIFTKVPVDSGDYTLKVEAPSFANDTRTFKVTTESGVIRNIELRPTSVVDETVVVAVVDAAAGLPPWVEGSRPAAGSLATLYGANIGPDTLGYNVLPLEESIAGFSFHTSQDSLSLVAFPIYAQANQSTIIIPSALEDGPTTLSVSGPAGEAASINLLVAEGVPQPFAAGGGGLGLGANTHGDGSPVTFNHPAKFDENLTGWFSKMGRRSDDTLFFANDLRQQSKDTFFHLIDGRRLPETNHFFLGTSGVGLGQSNFSVSESAPETAGVRCGTTIETVRVKQDGTTLRSNQVLLPFSTDGGPCNDSTGLGGLVNRLPGDGLALFAPEVTEARSYLLDRNTGNILSGPRDTFEVSNRLRQYNDFTYFPFPNSGSCSREWRPKGYGGAGILLIGDGDFLYTLEGTAQDNVAANSVKVYSRPTKGIPSGDLSFTITPSLGVNGAPFNSIINTQLHRDEDFYNLLLNATSKATASRPHPEAGELLGDILPIFGQLPSPAGRDTFAIFRTVADFGDLGSLTVNCGMSLADLASKAISADDIIFLYKDNATAQKLTISSAQPERITAVLTVYQDRVPTEITGAINGVLASLKTEFRWFLGQ